jgi:hypothetical protein
MVAVRAGNYTIVEDQFDLWVARIECHCSVYFQHYYPMLANCDQGVVMCQTARPMEPYWLSLAVFRSFTLYVNQQITATKFVI